MLRILALLALIATAADSAVLVPPGARFVTADGRVRVVGYNDMDEMLPRLGEAFTRRHPSVRFEFVLKGTRTAPSALLDGTSAFAPMGAEFEPTDLTAWREGRGDEPVAIPIAHDSFVPAALSSPTGILVHPQSPLRALTIDQVRRVVAPRVGETPLRTWGELGVTGVPRDRRIRVVGLARDTAIGALVLRRLGAADFIDGFVPFRQSRDVAAAVARDEDAIGIANLNHARELHALTIVDSRGRRVEPTPAGIRSGRYPFDRQLLIYARRAPGGRLEPLALAFIELCLSHEGQRIIASGARGYLPLNPRELAQARMRAGLAQ